MAWKTYIGKTCLQFLLLAQTLAEGVHAWGDLGSKAKVILKEQLQATAYGDFQDWVGGLPERGIYVFSCNI